MLDKEKIKKHFSRAAASYDDYAQLQRKIGNRLLFKLEQAKLESPRILDIGAGTGEIAISLAQKFKSAEIYACDIAPGMVKVADIKSSGLPNLYLNTCDAEALPFKDQNFDLVISNLAFQWMDPNKAFSEVARVLKPQGRFVFSTFGPRTLSELKRIESQLVHEFISSNLLIEILIKIGFKNINFDIQLFAEEYPDVASLFYSLKNLGAQNASFNSFGLGGKTRIKNLIDDYERKFKKGDAITATFEVFYISAKK